MPIVVIMLPLMSSSQAISNLPRKPLLTATRASSGHGKPIDRRRTYEAREPSRSLREFGFKGLMQSINVNCPA